MLQTRKCIITQ